MPLFRNHRFVNYLPLLLLSLCSMALVLIATSKYGAGVTPDSVNYISAAENFANGNGFINYQNKIYANWPPLYPLLLSVAAFIGIDLLAFATYANAILFALIVIVAGKWFLMYLGRVYATGATAAVAFGYPLLHISKCVWSEPLFLLLVLLVFWQMGQYLRKNNAQSFFWLCLALALAPLQRYAGLVLPAAVAFAFMVGPWHKGKPAKVAVVLAAGYFPVGLWLLRNFVTTGHFTGFRSVQEGNMLEILADAFSALAHWLGPFYMLPHAAGVYAGILSLAAIIVFGLIMWKRFGFRMQASGYVLLFFSLLYIFLLLFSSGKYGIDRIDHRLLSPLYPVIVLLIFKIGALIWQHSGRKSIKIFVNFFLMLFVMWHLIFTTYSARSDSKNGSYGYSTDRWHNSELIEHIRKGQEFNNVYSNAPDALWWFLRMEAGMLGQMPIEGSVVVHFHNTREYLPGSQQLKSAATKEIIFKDGSVFFIE